MNKQETKKIIGLMKRQVVPAVGCTEPVAVALCAAGACRMLPNKPVKVQVRASANIIKNAMGVGIPGTGMIGLPIAVALGALFGDPGKGLEVLSCACSENVAEAKKFIDSGAIVISLYENAPAILHIDVTATDGFSTSHAVISGSHTNFTGAELDGTSLIGEHREGQHAQKCDDTADDPALDMRTVFEFATETPVDQLRFILEAKRLNTAAARLALAGQYGHSLGSTVLTQGPSMLGDGLMCHAIAYTSAACDARMGGAPVAVMSNSGSGNQGITATMPVVVYAEETGADEEHTIRALTLSHLTSIYIKQSLGCLSALCGCVVASTGASAGIVYLMGGGYRQICAAIKNMVANLTGMICDGAKPSCSMKISSGVSTAMLSALLAMNGREVTQAEGIVSDDVDTAIHNLTSIGRESMRETDRLILHIMTHKC